MTSSRMLPSSLMLSSSVGCSIVIPISSYSSPIAKSPWLPLQLFPNPCLHHHLLLLLPTNPLTMTTPEFQRRRHSQELHRSLLPRFKRGWNRHLQRRRRDPKRRRSFFRAFTSNTRVQNILRRLVQKLCVFQVVFGGARGDHGVPKKAAADSFPYILWC